MTDISQAAMNDEGVLQGFMKRVRTMFDGYASGIQWLGAIRTATITDRDIVQ